GRSSDDIFDGCHAYGFWLWPIAHEPGITVLAAWNRCAELCKHDGARPYLRPARPSLRAGCGRSLHYVPLSHAPFVHHIHPELPGWMLGGNDSDPCGKNSRVRV